MTDSEAEKPKKNQSVMRSAAAMSLGTLSSRILGMVRDILLAALFPRTVTDAFVVAFRLPNMFRRLLGEGSLAVSFIPVFVSQLEGKDSDPVAAKQLSHAVFSLLMTVAASLCVLGVIFMEPLLSFLLSGKGYLAVEGKLDTTIFLARIMFSYLFLVTTYAFFMSLMQAMRYFFIPALAPAFFNLTFIFFALLPDEWGGVSGEMLAWGVIVGGIVQVMMVGVPLYKLGYLPRFNFQFKNVRGFSTVLLNLIPGLVGMGILQMMSLVNVSYASRLKEGAHSYIYWADRILEFPQSLLAISMGAALLPTLSSLWSRGERDEMRKVGHKHMRLLMFLALPCAVGMYVLAQPVVEVLFHRGSFTDADAQNTAIVIQVYSFLLLAVGLHKVTVPSFYAIKNTWLPAVTSAISLSIHVIVAYFWVDMYGLKGLVASTALAGFINMSLVLISYRIFIGELDVKGFLLSFFHMLPAAALMGVAVSYFHAFMDPIFRGLLPLELARFSLFFISILVGVIIYFAVNKLLLQPETNDILQMLKRRRNKVRKLR